MSRFVASRSPCPIGRASRVIGDRWVLLILREAYLGIDRFDGFLERLAISRATLTDRLAWMVDAGLLARDPPDGRRAVYRLTAAAEAFQPTFAALKAWGDDWLPVAGAAASADAP